MKSLKINIAGMLMAFILCVTMIPGTFVENSDAETSILESVHNNTSIEYMGINYPVKHKIDIKSYGRRYMGSVLESMNHL